MAPGRTVVIAAGLGLITVVALSPPFGVYLVLVATLLLAGIDRGVLIPLLRPQEAVMVLVALGIVLHVFVSPTLLGERRIRLTFDRVDGVLLFLAVSGSLLPLAFMLIREREIAQDDVLYALQMWKLYAVFLIARSSIRTPSEVNRCLWVAMAAAAIVALVGIFQSLGLFGVQGLMTSYFKPLEDNASSFDLTRATSTVGSAFAVGDIMLFCLAIAAGFLVRGHHRRVTLAALAALFVFGAVSAGQFSIIIGLGVTVLIFSAITRRVGRSLLAFAAVGIVAATVLQPVIDNRLQEFENRGSGLPRTWQGRLDNLETFFWSELTSDLNWVTGVRPDARVPAPEPWREWVYIESGHTWLLWTGGIVFLLAFFIFLAVAMPLVARAARGRKDAVGVAAIASFTALAVVAVLMIIDVHLTLRGAGELSFVLLALGLNHSPPPTAAASQNPGFAQARSVNLPLTRSMYRS